MSVLRRIRSTDLPGIISGLPRTIEGAQRAIREYEAANPDIPPQTRRLMALSVCGIYFGRARLEAAVGQKLPRLPFRDASWRWWKALEYSGLGYLWKPFIEEVRKGGLRRGATFLRHKVSQQEYALFLRRLGTNPHNYRRPTRDIVWTKGGGWRVSSPMTQLLVLKRHLPHRILLTPAQKKLGHAGIRSLERELMNLVDPDAMLSYEAKEMALSFARRRIAEKLGWKRRQVALPFAAWFFNQPVPCPKGTLAPDRTTGYVKMWRTKRSHSYWSW